MPSQIFKNPVPNELLKKLFDENAFKTDAGYTINNSTIFLNAIILIGN